MLGKKTKETAARFTDLQGSMLSGSASGHLSRCNCLVHPAAMLMGLSNLSALKFSAESELCQYTHNFAYSLESSCSTLSLHKGLSFWW